MLVVNLHTLQTIYVLNFVHDIFLYGSRTLNRQDVSRSDGTIRQWSTCTNVVVFLYKDLLGQVHQILLHFAGLRCHHDFAVTTLDLTHRDFTVDFRYHRRIGRVTGFEQFSNTWKTTGDIACLTYGTWNLHEDVTRLHGLTVFYHNVTTYREVVCTNRIAVFGIDMSRWNLGSVLRFDDDDFAQTGSVIDICLVSHVFNHRFEVNLTRSFGNDNGVERVPLGNELTLFHHFTIRCIELGTVRNVVSRKHDTCVDIHKTYFCQTAYHYLHGFAHFVYGINRTEFFEFQTGIVLGYDTCIGSDVTRSTPGVEGTEGQLSTRFTDGLGSDNADSFTLLNHAAGSQVTAITLRTNTLLRFTSQYRADFHAFDW